jgi:hypothetical protein
MMGMPALGVSQSQPAHEEGQVSIVARPEQEVEVVGQQAVGQQPHVVRDDGLG